MQKVQPLQRKILAVAIAAISLSPIAAHSEEKKAVQLEQVIVTAQKSDDRIQDIPSTINLVSGDLLSKMEINRFADLAQVTAGVSFDVLTGRRQSLNMRGVQTNPDGGFADGVAVYWNDMNVRTDVAFQQLFDIDRVEVLRGPQGTLQGATSPAGAIQIHTRMPYLEGFSGNIEQSFSNNNGSNTEFGVDLPLIPGQLAARVAGVYDAADVNDGKNLTTGQRMTSMTRAGRLSLLWQPGDIFTAKLAYEYLERFSDGGDIVAGPAQAGNPTVSPYDRNSIASINNFNRNRNQLTSLNLSWDLGRNQFTWETGYYKSRQFSLLDDDAGNIKSGYTGNLIPVNAERFIQEARLSTQVNDSWDSLVGFYYQNDKSHAVAILYPTTTQVVNDIPSHGETYALFTHQKFQVSENGVLELGLRYQKVNQFNASDILIYLMPAHTLYSTVHQISDAKAHDANAEVVTGSFKYSYNFTPDLMAYASYDQSFRPGGVTPTTTQVNPEYLSYDQEKSQGIELGIKSTWFDNRLRVNADVFYQQLSDALYRSQGLLVNTSKGPSTIRLVYNADSVVQGAELELEGLVTENWRLGSNLSYVDAKYDGATIPCNTPTSSSNPLGVVSMCDSSGRAGTEPNWSATANSFYTLPLGSVEAYVNLLLKYQSFRDDDTLAGSKIGGFSTTNLYVGVHDVDKVWDVSIWAKNLFNKDAQVVPAEQIAANTTYLRVRPNEPRTVGVTLKYSFGAH